MLAIHWTTHASERFNERFSHEPWRVFPENLIRRAAEKRAYGEDFRVRRGLATYVCTLEANGIVILTVYKKGERDGHNRKQARQQYGRLKR